MKIKSNHIWLILSLLITVFIFSNSIQPASDSSQKSGLIVNFICSLFNITTAERKAAMVFIIRKSAHAAEFAALSFCYSMYFKKLGKSFLKLFRYVLLIGLSTACIDEFLQLFPEGRSCEFCDVLIDFSGVIIGIFIPYIFCKITKKAASLLTRGGQKA